VSSRPLVFLDVDGVINDIEANQMLSRLSGPLEDRARRLGVDIVQVRGRRMAVPHHIPALIRRLADTTEVWWCTTWRAKANGDLTKYLGVDAFPVVDPYGRDAGIAWKAAAVAPIAQRAISEGRKVVWIEDFNGNLPELADAHFIDTGPVGYLRREDLNDWTGL